MMCSSKNVRRKTFILLKALGGREVDTSGSRISVRREAPREQGSGRRCGEKNTRAEGSAVDRLHLGVMRQGTRGSSQCRRGKCDWE